MTLIEHNLPMARPSPQRRVVLIVFPGVQTLDVAGPAEAFAGANRVSGCRLYDVVTASADGAPVVTTAGFALSTTALSDLRPGPRDTVLVAGGDEAALTAVVADTRITRWLQRAWPRVERLGSVCSGAFVLAVAGLLAGRRAATHWSGCDRLAQLEPRAKVDRDAIFVTDGRLWTSAGVTTGIDMALAMVEADHGGRLVGDIAARLVLYARRPGFQSQWSSALVAQRDASDPLGTLIGWARERLDEPLSVDTLARRAGLSPRTFHRRCVANLRTTPARLVAKLRVERARTLLTTSHLSAKEIAAQCGLRDGAELARLVRRALGVGPREYRALFAAREVAAP
jgi:transcriptional regulator GlxA family with amidase domain